MIDQAEYWRSIAERWRHIGPPLRPSEQDLFAFQSALRASEVRTALILGVTPELERLNFPSSSTVYALDRTEGMIRAIWPGSLKRCVHGSWCEMPFAENVFDVIFCDGGFHLVERPLAQRNLVSQLARCLKPDGAFVLRLFSQPSTTETSQEVLEDLRSGRISTMNHLKMRLGMAMQRSSEEGVALREIWSTVDNAFPELTTLAQMLNWPLEQVVALNSYRDAPNRYYFSTTEETIAAICGVGEFRVESISVPTYALGDRCPTIRFRRIR